MTVDSYRWDRKQELIIACNECIRKGTLFTVGTKSVFLRNESVTIERLVERSKNTGGSVTISGIVFTRLEAEKLHKNLITWEQAQSDYLAGLLTSLDGKTTFTDIGKVVWVDQTPTLDPVAEMVEDILEHHDNRYQKKGDPSGGSVTYSFSGDNHYLIDHLLGYYPTVIVMVGGGEVIAQVDHTSKNSVEVSFTKTTACEITIG